MNIHAICVHIQPVQRCQILLFFLQLFLSSSCLVFQLKSYSSLHRLFIDPHNKARNPYNRDTSWLGEKGAKGTEGR